MNRSGLKTAFLILTAVLVAACAAMTARQFPAEHPIALERGRPTCTECHEARTAELDYRQFDHGVYFMENHRFITRQHEALCAMCHQTSFCNDCHATRVELKPSERHQTENFRRMPHRGEYLSRHQVEGRIDPVSCYRCHGNPKTARTCARCHP